MGWKKQFNVEIFCNGCFVQWFPANSMSEILIHISRYEGVSKLKDLKLSYLIFQPNPNGRWESLGSRYHMACRINSNGKEKPEFFKIAA